jgi:predicted DNA-binding transcriptional regulator AlpA
VHVILPGWPRALSIKLAAAYVGLSVTTIRHLPGFPAPVPLSPGRVAYLREDLDRWLDQRAGRTGKPDGSEWLTLGKV